MIGELFRKAWQLYKRDVWMLIAAGFIVALIFGGAAVVVGLAVFAVAKTVIHTDSTGAITSSNLTTTIGATLVAVVIGVTLASIVALVFSGGMYEMVVGAEREQRSARLGDLFSGFRHFGSYAMLWLCQVGIVLGVELVCFLALRVLGVLALPVMLAGFAVMVWVSVSWIYGVVLIADRGLGGVDALRESLRMVKVVGWWSTFGALLVLGVCVLRDRVSCSPWPPDAPAGVLRARHGRLLHLLVPLQHLLRRRHVPGLQRHSGRRRRPAVHASARRACGRLRHVRRRRLQRAAAAARPAARTAPGGSYQPAVAPAANADAWKAAADPLAAFPVQSLHASKPSDPGRGVPRQAAPRKAKPAAPAGPAGAEAVGARPRRAAASRAAQGAGEAGARGAGCPAGAGAAAGARLIKRPRFGPGPQRPSYGCRCGPSALPGVAMRRRPRPFRPLGVRRRREAPRQTAAEPPDTSARWPALCPALLWRRVAERRRQRRRADGPGSSPATRCLRTRAAAEGRGPKEANVGRPFGAPDDESPTALIRRQAWPLKTRRKERSGPPQAPSPSVAASQPSSSRRSADASCVGAFRPLSRVPRGQCGCVMTASGYNAVSLTSRNCGGVRDGRPHK